jgi:hypothetical protein
MFWGVIFLKFENVHYVCRCVCGCFPRTPFARENGGHFQNFKILQHSCPSIPFVLTQRFDNWMFRSEGKGWENSYSGPVSVPSILEIEAEFSCET